MLSGQTSSQRPVGGDKTSAGVFSWTWISHWITGVSGRQPASHPQQYSPVGVGRGSGCSWNTDPGQREQKSSLFRHAPATRGAARDRARTPRLGPGAGFRVPACGARKSSPRPSPPLRWGAVQWLSRCHRWVRDCLCTGPGSEGAACGGSASAWGGKGVAAQTRTRAPAYPKAGGRCG